MDEASSTDRRRRVGAHVLRAGQLVHPGSVQQPLPHRPDVPLQVDRDDLTALRIELARFVGELLKDHAEQIWVDEEWRIDVTDQAGLILYVMEITTSDTAATMGLPR